MIRVYLTDEQYAALCRWLASAAPAVAPQPVSITSAVRAMIDATVSDTAVTSAVLARLRHVPGGAAAITEEDND